MYDISMVSKDQVLALINQEAGLSITHDQVTFDVPNINTNPSKERNTELLITGIPEFGFKGSAYVYYNRIDLQQFTTHARDPFVIQVDVEEGESLTLEKLTEGFNRYFGSALAPDDISSELDLGVDFTNGVEFQMDAAEWSYAYRGSVTFILRPMDVDIDTAIENKLLDGLTLNMPA